MYNPRSTRYNLFYHKKDGRYVDKNFSTASRCFSYVRRYVGEIVDWCVENPGFPDCPFADDSRIFHLHVIARHLDYTHVTIICSLKNIDLLEECVIYEN